MVRRSKMRRESRRTPIDDRHLQCGEITMKMLAENYRCAIFVRRDKSRVVQLSIREASNTYHNLLSAFVAIARWSDVANLAA